MRKSALLLGILMGGLALPVLADSEGGGAQKVPNFSGGWAKVGTLVESFDPIPGYTGPGPITVDPKHPHVEGGTGTEVEWVADLNNPILKPETRAKLQVIVDNEIKGIPHIKDEGVCQPSGVPMILNRRGGAIQMLQTATEVTIINARDEQVRHIYLDVPHSKNPGHTWNGESVGHYENGDTLVVDTVGENDKTQVDRFGTWHSDQIHVIERYKLAADRKSMDVEITVDDPVAYTTPWKAHAVFNNRPGIPAWDEQVCAENNRFVGTITYGGKIMNSVPTPTASKADF